MAVREGKWRCSNCRVVNRGRDLNCTGCGVVRGNVKFFLDEEAPEVQDEGLAKRATDGPDWICAFCDTSNVQSATVCKQCAGARTEGKQRETAVRQDAREDASAQIRQVNLQTIRDDTPSPTPAPSTAAKAAPAAPSETPKGSAKGCCGCFATLFALFLLFGLYDSLFTSTEIAEVVNRSWKRTLHLQVLVDEPWQGWEKEKPPKFRVSRSESRVSGHTKTVIGYDDVEEKYQEKELAGTKTKTKTVRRKVQTGTKQVKTGVRDLGNGFFEDVYKEVPVYDYENETVEEEVPVYRNVTRTRIVKKPRYRHDPINENWLEGTRQVWKKADSQTSQGTFEPPAWPPVPLGTAEATAVGTYLESGREEAYQATLRGVTSGKTHEVTTIKTRPLDSALFEKLTQGSRWQLEISGLGSLDGLTPVAP
ncbi:MAG TPA: hypothetical protein PKO06_05910 [Candidatus Ozemobacteraceae bacterium]|nr:hypothetical protein [Candidatus Ozemobacteraceae bacterium]